MLLLSWPACVMNKRPSKMPLMSVKFVCFPVVYVTGMIQYVQLFNLSYFRINLFKFSSWTFCPLFLITMETLTYLNRRIFAPFSPFRFIKQGDKVNFDVRNKGKKPEEIGFPEYSKKFLKREVSSM